VKETREKKQLLLDKTRRVGFFFLSGSYLPADAGIIENKKQSK